MKPKVKFFPAGNRQMKDFVYYLETEVKYHTNKVYQIDELNNEPKEISL